MPHFAQALARSPWRVRVTFDTAPGGATTPGTYALARADGAGPAPSVARVLTLDAAAFELVLADGLLEGLAYTLTATGVTGSGTLSFLTPPASGAGAAAVDDPEAEAFGVDHDWLAPALAPGGDLPVVRGRACLVHDLAAIAVTAPGELFHRPEAGAGLTLRVNGPNVPADLADARAAVKREWLKDDRVRGCSVTATATSDGAVNLAAQVESVAVDEPVDVVMRRS